jgi:hypothetical protein
MNLPNIPACALIVSLGFSLPRVQAQLTQGFAVGESGVSQLIPDNDPSGIARTFQTSGLSVGIPYDLTVSLSVEPTGLGAFNGDYYAYLLHETSSGSEFRLAVLMNRVGSSASQPNGYSDSGFRLTFSDSALHDIHQYRVSLGGAPTGLVSGTWQPDGRRIDPFLALDTSPRSAFLAPLGQMDPNGQWTLFVADMEAGGTGKLTGWEVRAVPSATVIPEPSTVWMLGIAGLAWMGCRRRRSAGRPPGRG